MKFPFFGKHDKEHAEESNQGESSIVPQGDLGIVPVGADDCLDLDLYEHVTLPADSANVGPYIDALIPLAGGIADATGQWDQAIVRFPEGTGWNDLLNRKTPGWEDWKQLGILKDGKFQPQAAIRQAKLQPAAVANLALQGAAVIVGQAYIAEISKQIDGIQSSISAIQQEMRMERESNVEASFELLREYLARYDEISENAEKRQAVQGAIEGIKKDALSAWSFELKAMHPLDKQLAAPRRMKNEDVLRCITEFRTRERDAQAAFLLLLAADQAGMQYSGDFSENSIAFERDRLQKAVDEYKPVRDSIQVALGKRIDKISGNLLEVPQAADDGYKPINPLFDTVHLVGQNAQRLWLPAMVDEAKNSLDAKKRRLNDAVITDDPIARIAEARNCELDQIEFIYNRADAMLFDEGGVHFVVLNGDKSNMQELNDGKLSAPASA